MLVSATNRLISLRTVHIYRGLKLKEATFSVREVQWHIGRALNNRVVLGLILVAPSCVLEQDTTVINYPEYWLKPREWRLCPNITEKLLTVMLNLNTNKQTNIQN